MKNINIKKCVALFLAVTLVASQFGGYISADAADERYVMTPSDLNGDGSTSGATSTVTTYQGVDAYQFEPDGTTSETAIKRARWNLAGKNLSASSYKYVAVDYYYDVVESTGGSWRDWFIGDTITTQEQSDEVEATYGAIEDYNKELVGDSNPNYMLHLTTKWQDFYQWFGYETGTTYVLTCDYYIPEGSTGSIRFYPGLAEEVLEGGTSGTATLEYTTTGNESWTGVGPQQNADGEGYYWNFRLTKKGETENLLKNGDFGTGDYNEWTHSGNGAVVVFDTAKVGDSNPKYMAHLYASDYQDIRQFFSDYEVGATYVFTCNYFVPENSVGNIRFQGASGGDSGIVAEKDLPAGTSGVATLEYTVKEGDQSWFGAGLVQKSGEGYYWNLSVTKVDSSDNLLQNADFAVYDTTANTPEYMTIRMAVDSDNFSDWKNSENVIQKNQWARVIFDVSDLEYEAEISSYNYNQMHFFPWGCDSSGNSNGLNTGATAEGTMYINNLSFYTSNPGEPSITGVSFVSDELEVLCGGSVAVPNVTVSGENYPITAYDLTLSGHSSSDTYISEGRLYIGEDETATELIIQAAAVVDSTQTATCKVSIVNSINRTEFDEENIVTRFGVVSDTHVSGSWNQERSIGKFAHMIDAFQKTAADDGATLDALLVNGDFVDAVASSGNVQNTSTYGSKETQNFREVNYVAQGLWGTNPEYMAHLSANNYKDVRQWFKPSEGTTYVFSFDYYMESGSVGTIRFWSATKDGTAVEVALTADGSVHTAQVEYTAQSTDTWCFAGMVQHSGEGYYWNCTLTEKGSEKNILVNADFSVGDGSWSSWSIADSATESEEIVPYDEWLCGDASESGLNKTDTTTGYGTGLYEGTRLFYSLGNHDETGEGKAELNGYDTVYSAEYFAAVFCGWQYGGTEGDTSYRSFIQDLIAYHAYCTSGTETTVTANTFYSTYSVTLASAYQKFVKFYGFDEDYSSDQGLLYGNRHMTIGEGNDAIHFVALELSLSDTSLKFLENICETSVKEDINKPIFVLTHYKVSENMPGYGANDVEDKVREVMAKYPQIILFGGHSHTYLHSDLAIDSDAGFIQVDTSTTAYASQSYLINAALSGVTGQWDSAANSWVYPENANAKENHAYSMGCYVEVDKNFNVRIKRIDLYRSYSAEYAKDSALYSVPIFTDYANQASAEATNGAVFVRDAWDITDIGTAGLHLADYNTTTRKADTTAPVLTEASSIEATVTSADSSKTITANVRLDATDDGLVYMYVVELWNKDTGELTDTKYLTNKFYDYPDISKIPVLEETVTFTGITDDSTVYEVKAYPIDEFKVKGDAITVVAGNFATAEGATISTSDQTVKMGFRFTETRKEIEEHNETASAYGTVLYAGTTDWSIMKANAETFITNNYNVTDGVSGYAITTRTIGTEESELPDVYSVLISNSNSGDGYDNRGRRITAIAYVVTEEGNVYYSDTVINHSVMSVLKNIYNETYLTDEANVVDGEVVSNSLLAKALEQSQATYSDLKAALTAAPTSAAQRDLLFDVHYALNNYEFVLADTSTLQLYAQSGGTDAESATLRTAIMTTADDTSILSTTGKTYYISETGSDENTGTSSDMAVASYSAISSDLESGDNVLFERGGVYRGCIELKSGVTYAAYGTGDKPAIYGSAKNYCYDGAWIRTGTENVWVCADKVTEDIGTIVFDHGWAAGRRIYTGTSELGKNFEFYQVIDSGSDDYGKVYLYLDRDPVETFYDIEFCVEGNILNAGENTTYVTIDNLCIKYGGSHGIRFDNDSSNITITNCELAWIGGSLQKGDGTSFDEDASIRYGNAVEFWQNTDTVTVSNNWVYQIYDAGLTHQGTLKASSYLGGFIYIAEGYTQKAINFTGNLIEYCSYGIEYFTGNYEKDVWSDITYSGNIIRFAGYGWGQVRPNSWAVSSICGWGGNTHLPFSSTNFVIKNNHFDRSTDWLVLHYYKESVDGATYDKYDDIVTFTGNSYYQDPCQKDENGSIWGAHVAYWLISAADVDQVNQLDIWSQERFEEVVAQIEGTTTDKVTAKYLKK